MILDQQNQFSAAQALTVSAASTNYIDLSQSRQIDMGNEVGVLLTVNVAIGGTTPTFAIDVRTDASSSFGTDTPLFSVTIPAAKLTLGAKFYFPLPTGIALILQYIRCFYTLGGTSPTITVTTELQPKSMVDEYVNYKSGFAVLG